MSWPRLASTTWEMKYARRSDEALKVEAVQINVKTLNPINIG